MEIVNALRAPGSTAQQVRQILDVHKNAFEEARKEASGNRHRFHQTVLGIHDLIGV